MSSLGRVSLYERRDCRRSHTPVSFLVSLVTVEYLGEVSVRHSHVSYSFSSYCLCFSGRNWSFSLGPGVVVMFKIRINPGSDRSADFKTWQHLNILKLLRRDFFFFLQVIKLTEIDIDASLCSQKQNKTIYKTIDCFYTFIFNVSNCCWG